MGRSLVSESDLINDIKSLIKGKNRPIIGVIGHHGAGKTTFISHLQSKIRNHYIDSFRFDCDWFFFNDSNERRKRIGAAIESGSKDKIIKETRVKDWYDWKAIERALRELQTHGHFSIANAWNQQNGLKDQKVNVHVSEDSPIFCDGHYILEPSISEIFSLIIFVDAPLETCRKRLLIRDAERKGQDRILQTAKYYHSQLEPYFKQLRSKIDYIIREGENSEYNYGMK